MAPANASKPRSTKTPASTISRRCKRSRRSWPTRSSPAVLRSRWPMTKTKKPKSPSSTSKPTKNFESNLEAYFDDFVDDDPERFVERLYETLRADLPKYEVENKG
jgi:hypothetical protein